MGASLNGLRFADRTRATIEQDWKDAVEQSQYQSGHSYSGEIGMLGTKIAAWRDLNLASEDAAYQWLADHHEKWEPAIAVSFTKDGAKFWLVGGWCSS